MMAHLILGRRLVFWQCPLYRNSIKEITSLIPDLVLNNITSITFCQSRRDVEVATREIRETLALHHGSSHRKKKVSAYRSGLTPDERRLIELNLRTGKLGGVVSTNALELGIDIGSLDVVVMAGFPGTKASFWQQAGRAGRRSGNAWIIIILSNSPIEHYISQNPNWLTDSSVENAIVDVSNIFIQLAHIRAAAYELPLSSNDIKYFHDLGVVVPKLVEIGELCREKDQFLWSKQISSNPAMEISMRNMSNESIDVVDSYSEKTITSTDLITAKYELFPGAIYLHEGVQYKVLTLDFESKQARLIGINSAHYTVPFVNTSVQILETVYHKQVHRCQTAWGDVKVIDLINAYKKIQYFTHNNLGFEELDSDLSVELDTEGTWLVLPENMQALPKRLGSGHESPVNRDSKYDIDGLVFALVNAASIRTMASYGDIGGTIFGLEKSHKTALLIYDKYNGGLGFAQKINEVMEDVILDAIKIVESCPCKQGCPSCVGHMQINKDIVLWALHNLIEESPTPEFLETMPQILPCDAKTTIRRKYKLEWVKEHWKKYIYSFKFDNPRIHEFLMLTHDVVVFENTIQLFIWKSRINLLPNYEEDSSAIKEVVQKSIYEQPSIILSLQEDPVLHVKKAKLDRYFDKSSGINPNAKGILKNNSKSTDTSHPYEKTQKTQINNVTLHKNEEQGMVDVDLLFKCLESDNYEPLLKLKVKSLLYIFTTQPGNKDIDHIRIHENYQAMLMYVSRMHNSTKVQCAALSLIKDEQFIINQAFNNLFASVRETAANMIVDPQLILKIALNDKSSRIRSCLVERITDPGLLEQIVLFCKKRDTVEHALGLINDIDTLKRLASEGKLSVNNDLVLSKLNNPRKWQETNNGVTANKRLKKSNNTRPKLRTTVSEKRTTLWAALYERYREELADIKFGFLLDNANLHRNNKSLYMLIKPIFVEKYSPEKEQDLFTIIALKRTRFELNFGISFPNAMRDAELIFKHMALNEGHLKSKLAAIRGIEDQQFLKYLIFSGAGYDHRLAATHNLQDHYLLEQLSVIDRSKVVNEQAYQRLLDLQWAANRGHGIEENLEDFFKGTSLVFVDTETTGLTSLDRICQIALVKVNSSGIETFMDYCNPHVPVNPFAFDVHGLSNSFLKKQKDFKKTQTYKMLRTFINEKCVFVFHNAPFDLRFIGYEDVKIENAIVDTMKILRQKKCFSDNKLKTALQFLKIVFKELDVKQHDALGDAMTTFYLLKWLYNAYPYHVGRIISEGGNYSPSLDTKPTKPTKRTKRKKVRPKKTVEPPVEIVRNPFADFDEDYDEDSDLDDDSILDF